MLAAVLLLLAGTIAGAHYRALAQRERDTQQTTRYAPTLPITEHRRGREDAPLQLYVYFDTDCPYCARFHQRVLPELLRRYKDQIAVSYLYLPLQSHPKALGEAILAECVSKIGGEEYFWPAMDLLLRIELEGARPSPGDIDRFAATYNIPAAPLSLCISDNATLSRIRRDIFDAALREVSGVPTIIVAAHGKSEIVSTSNIQKLQPVIDEVYRIK